MNKYQIFVSSTYEDLKEERNQVIKAILEMGHIPVGMEMFSAADEEQWKLIARQIDETDYYVVMVAHRYGSMVGTTSYTEMEYDYAVSKGVPVYGFIVDDSVEPLAKNKDSSNAKVNALGKFKTKVKQRPVGFWKTADDLHGKVSIALMKAFNTTPRTGWTRAAAIAGPEVSQELSRLSKENSELRLLLEKAINQEAIDKRAHLQSQIETLKAIPKALRLREAGKETWDLRVSIDLFEIFSQLAPEMMVEISLSGASHYLANTIKPDKNTKLTQRAPIAENHMRSLFADMASLDLIEPSKKKHPVADLNDYWSLTQSGLDILKIDRAHRLELVAASLAPKKR
jgi:nucleoside 2-deoxyribosyltransferase